MGWGSSKKGVGFSKSSVCPSKSRETKLSGGISWDFAWISRGHPKSLRKKVCVQFSSPTKSEFSGSQKRGGVKREVKRGEMVGE